MTFGLLVSLALLGLSAIDPVGLAAMPVLLSQKRPFVRSFMFLGGSLFALMAMGLLFAKGAGVAVLHFETSHSRFVPSVEIGAGIVLLSIAATLFWRLKTHRLSIKGPAAISANGARFGHWQLFMFGAELVAVQSVIDVVFVVAMIRIGQLHMSWALLIVAVLAYAVPALLLQAIIVSTYAITPADRRTQTLARVHKTLTNYANQTIIYVSLTLGLGLIANGWLAFAGWAHL